VSKRLRDRSPVGTRCKALTADRSIPDCRTFNVLDDQELREGIKEYSSWPTIPQVYLKGDFLGGFDIMLSSKSRGAARLT
jgi:glutaredoxin-related protein